MESGAKQVSVAYRVYVDDQEEPVRKTLTQTEATVWARRYADGGAIKVEVVRVVTTRTVVETYK